jgi:hypothetical protein
VTVACGLNFGVKQREGWPECVLIHTFRRVVEADSCVVELWYEQEIWLSRRKSHICS